MSDPFVVVGGDAAGLSAASKCKRETPDREVVVFEKGQWVSYAHCGMPYYVKGEVDSLDSLLSLTPTEIRERDIDLRRNHEVVDVDTGAKTVTVESATERFEQPYGDLLIATGARAMTAPIPGTDLDGVFTMHSLDSAAAVRAFLTPPEEIEAAPVDNPNVDSDLVNKYAALEVPSTVAIVGGGYVGVEMAEAFSAYDCSVHMFQRSSQLVPPFGETVGEQVAASLKDAGVTLHLESEVDELTGSESGAVSGVTYDGKSQVDVDLALVGIGIRPNTDLLDDTDVELGESAAIATDDYGQTSCEDVYAAGDCAEMRHTVTGEPAWVPLGLTANRAGRAIGQTVAGSPTPVGDIAGTAVLKAFELECGRVGLVDPGRAAEAGFAPVTETVTTRSRSGYYPGAAETAVTLTADESGRLLGGSIAGEDRAAIRIDTLATALEAEMTVAELERLDLAYAPPFSPVWDPVLVAAKVLNGRLDESTAGEA